MSTTLSKDVNIVYTNVDTNPLVLKYWKLFTGNLGYVTVYMYESQ